MSGQVITRDQLLAQARGQRGQGIASQATHVEQARAVAQVQGALVVAQERPRDVKAAWDRMREACELSALAERAFFSFQRAGSKIAGPSIHLATELARCWGNVDYGITELRRDMVAGESEMQAYAWDLETNARVTNSFIVPHTRDTKKGPVDLTDARDLYENNANAAARRLRECIFRILPVSFREEAETLCSDTLENGGGEPIEKRRERMLDAFAAFKVTRRMIEARMDIAADRLTAQQLAQLSVIYQTIKRGETTVAAEFDVDTSGEAMAELKAGASLPNAPGAKVDTPDSSTESASPKTIPLYDESGTVAGNYPNATDWLAGLEMSARSLPGIITANWEMLTRIATNAKTPADVKERAQRLRDEAPAEDAA